MTEYVIVRNDGAFVADMNRSTTGGSYTRNILQARFYSSESSARADCCPENETPVRIDSYFERSAR